MNPVQEILFFCCSIGNCDEHIRQFASVKCQIIAIPFQKKLCHHGPDPLVAVHKSMIGCKTETKSGDLFKIRGIEFLTVKGLHWSRNSRLQPIPIPEAVQSSAAFYDPAVDQDDILC